MWHPVAVATAGLVATVAAAQQHQFSIHDDLLAFPQFKVAFPDAYILEADAQSKLDFASSSSSSAKTTSQTTLSGSSDNVPSVRTQAGSRDGQHGRTDYSDLPQSYEYMVLDTTPYLCAIPQVEHERRNDTKLAADEAEDQKELNRARIRGSELIGAMDENCLYYMSGWWSYSFCHNSEVKQFHQLPPGRNGVPFHPPIEDRGVPSYILGQYVGPKPQKPKQVDGRPSSGDSATSDHDSQAKPPKKATDLVQVQSKGNLKYLVQKLDDGTICDLTGRPRRIEVQYHCNPQTKDRISWIKEISTCSYLMMVYTSRLCDDIAFSPPHEDEAHQIVCREIVPEEKLEAWQSRKAARKVAELLNLDEPVNQAHKQVEGEKQPADAKVTPVADAGEDKPKGIIIGGIELGGQKTVGMPGKRIEPPQAFSAPQKDAATKVNVIVHFDPKKNGGKWVTLSDKDLKKLGVDAEIAHEMAEEMYAYERERKWRIEIAKTADGDELRGVIDGDEEITSKNKEGDSQGSEEEYYRDEL